MWQVAVTDLNGLSRAFASDYDAINITPNLNGYRELSIGIDPLDDCAGELLVAERAVKVYDSLGALQFNGKIWEPLERQSGGIKVVARGPVAEFSWRRVRSSTTYSATNNAGGPWDAGQILFDRIAVQNGYRNTYLKAGTRQASTNRVRTYAPGLLEADVMAELVNASGGFFFLEQPLDHDPQGYMAQANVLYPSAGATRLDVRFEWGAGTIDNCVDYDVVSGLPRTRQVVSSSSGSGTGRIAAAAEDAAAIARFGIFEDEEAYTDVTDVNLLQQQAQGDLRLVAPTTIAMTTGLEAPVLFRDFNVGDFVRVKIVHGSYSFEDWARVAAATITVDSDNVETTSSITLELLAGGSPLRDPELAFYDVLDQQRRRLEALERAVELANLNGTAPPAPPSPTGSGTQTSPPPPTTTPPPPPAPKNPPTIANLAASGQWDQTGSPYAAAIFDVDPQGQATTVWLEVVGRALPPQTSIGTAKKTGLELTYSGLTANTPYTVIVHAKNAAGETTQQASITTPRVRFF